VQYRSQVSDDRTDAVVLVPGPSLDRLCK